MKFNIPVLLLILIPNFLFAQAVIELKNPSFEGFQRAGQIGGRMPAGWYDCGFVGQTVPDVHPIPGGAFEVTKPPADGESYLGMVVRENDTWEAISQGLPENMEAGKCYYFSMKLCRSLLYLSANRLSPDSVINYATPSVIRIWGGIGFCNKKFLLAESSLITNDDWEEYEFYFHPEEDLSHIMFEVFYNLPTLFPYNGNVLLDNASDILEIPCDLADSVIDSIKQERAIAKSEAKAKAANAPIPNRNYKKRANNRLSATSYIKQNWEKVVFVNHKAALTEEANDMLYEFASKYEGKANKEFIVIRLALGTRKLAQERIASVRNVLLEGGLFEKEFSVKQVMNSDLRSKWDSKNDYLWIRFE